MLLFAEKISPRLAYTADFIGGCFFNEAISITDSVEVFRQFEGPRLNYSRAALTNKEFHIVPLGLLEETGIRAQTLSCFKWKDRKAFFATGGGDIPFDVFSAIFFLLSRYEEYLPFTPDIYGRYPHTQSLAWREGFLDQPLADQWLEDLRAELNLKFPELRYRQTAFKFLPTYDIDMAWSYRHKGIWRNLAGGLRSLLQADWKGLGERIRVLQNRQADPFDSYALLEALHEEFGLSPRYFFLLAGQRGKYDKNISPRQPAFRHLIREISARYAVGIHPSWKSGDEKNLLKMETDELAAITGLPVLASRQHYIRFQLPETFQRLINAGISQDFSMGYGSINGFRASVARPFYWYNLEREEKTRLLLFPFCFMDANAFYEQGLDAAAAKEEFLHYYRSVKAVHGLLISVWHNNFLGGSAPWTDWAAAYRHVLTSIAAGGTPLREP